MTPVHWLPLLAPTLLFACSSAAPAPASPAPSDPPTVADPGWTPVDPRIVRCGLDDRPRNVVSALPSRDRRALLAEVAAPEPVPAARPRPPSVAPITLPPGTDPEVVDLAIEPLPLSNPSGGPVPASLSLVDPHYEVCASLAQASEPLGPVTFGLELASNGSPLRVLPPDSASTPTPLVRCLMERACQLQASASPPGQKTLLTVPLRLLRGASPAQPPPTPTAGIRIDVATEKPRPERARLQLQLRGAASDAMRLCGAVPDRVRVRLSLDLQPPPLSPRRPRRSPVPVLPHGLHVAGQRTETLEGTAPVAVVGCVVNAVRTLLFDEGEIGPRQAVSEALILTWNP